MLVDVCGWCYPRQNNLESVFAIDVFIFYASSAVASHTSFDSADDCVFEAFDLTQHLCISKVKQEAVITTICSTNILHSKAGLCVVIIMGGHYVSSARSLKHSHKQSMTKYNCILVHNHASVYFYFDIQLYINTHNLNNVFLIDSLNINYITSRKRFG